MKQRHPHQFGMMFYKSARPGIAGIYNRVVKAWDRGPYSHVEVTFTDGWSASSSFEDKGVRFKMIDFDPAKWDFVPLPPDMETYARLYFIERANRKVKYDLRGNLHFVIGFIPHGKGEFCSESGAGALGLDDPWRFTPNSLASAARRIRHQYEKTPALAA